MTIKCNWIITNGIERAFVKFSADDSEDATCYYLQECRHREWAKKKGMLRRFPSESKRMEHKAHDAMKEVLGTKNPAINTGFSRVQRTILPHKSVTGFHWKKKTPNLPLWSKAIGAYFKKRWVTHEWRGNKTHAKVGNTKNIHALLDVDSEIGAIARVLVCRSKRHRCNWKNTECLRTDKDTRKAKYFVIYQYLRGLH